MIKFRNQNLLRAVTVDACRITASHFYGAEVHFIQHLRRSNDIHSATSAHAFALKSGLFGDTSTSNHLINAYIKRSKIEDAYQLFDEMPEPNVVSFSSLMASYIHLGLPQNALSLFREMGKSSVLPNEFTFSALINACSILSDLRTGRKVHACVEIMGFQCNLVVCSSLVDMYGKCNDVDSARRVFDSMDYKNVVSWTSMIAAYAQNARGHEAHQIFREFHQLMSDYPNQFMLASVINACAGLGKLMLGKATHGAVIRRGHESNDVVANALVDMYAKCGYIVYSDKVFRRIPTPSVVSYTSMIVSAAKHGLGKFALQLFGEMLSRNIRPNEVTFVGVLHACSHAGLVDEGLGHLNSMRNKHGVVPNAKHYSCVVDMLGRTGHLDEAYQLARSIKGDDHQDALVWGTVLSASRLQGRVDIAVEASKRLMKSNQQLSDAYVNLSKTYAVAGEWDNAQSLRSEMKRSGVSKEPGCSWVEIKDSTYVFYAGDETLDRGSEIFSLLKELERKMREKGYSGGTTGLITIEVEEEAQREMVALHSEKLALAFGLLNVPNGLTIRIMKNLRMCRDCHEAFKLISEITERDFVVRDLNRFHHFKNGSCTCEDFW